MVVGAEMVVAALIVTAPASTKLPAPEIVVATGMVMWLPEATVQTPPLATEIGPAIVPVLVLLKVAVALDEIVIPTLIVTVEVKVTLAEGETTMGTEAVTGVEMVLVPVPEHVICPATAKVPPPVMVLPPVTTRLVEGLTVTVTPTLMTISAVAEIVVELEIVVGASKVT
jgi:hypothetical protein